MQGFLLGLAPYVENEACGVSFRHPRPYSGGGRSDFFVKAFFTVPTPMLLRKRETHRRQSPAGHLTRHSTW